jgi:NTP pyrophosphatase (non-canonical NTP hydrolase)
MNRKEMFLIKMSEEAAEFIQATIKAGRFGLEEKGPGEELTNVEKIREEMSDLLAVYIIFCEEFFEDSRPLVIDMSTKRARLEKYFEVSRSVGTLKDES